MARIAVGGFQHETNTFAPLTASWADFERADAWPPFVRGPQLIEAVEGFNIPIAGAVSALQALGHDPPSAKTSKSPAQRFENRYRGSQPAASCFGDQRDALADTRIRYRREQAVVIEDMARDGRLGGAARNIPLCGAAAHAKEIELLDGHHLTIELSQVSVLEN